MTVQSDTVQRTREEKFRFFMSFTQLFRQNGHPIF